MFQLLVYRTNYLLNFDSGEELGAFIGIANSNEGQHSSCFKTKIFLFHYSSKEYLTWPQSVGRVLLLRYAKNTIRNRQYVRT